MATNFHYSRGRFYAAGYSTYTSAGAAAKKSGTRSPIDVNSWNSTLVAPADGPPLFYVGTVCLRDIHDLLKDLSAARHSTGIVPPTAYASRQPEYTFMGWGNFDVNKPTTRIFAVPRCNEWLFSKTQLQQVIETYEHAHPLICTFIEGWMAARYDAQGIEIRR